MKQGYILTEVSCRTCGLNVSVAPVIADSLETVKRGASQIHLEHNAASICPKPLLIEIYLPCLVSNELMQPAPQIVASANGH